MSEEKLIQSLKNMRRGLGDVKSLVGKIDAGSVGFLLSMYMEGIGTLIHKIEEEGIQYADEP